VKSSMMKGVINSGLLLLFGLGNLSSYADPWQFSGHIKYQLSRTDYDNNDLFRKPGDSPAIDHEIDLRLKAERRWRKWDTQIHYQLLAVAGDTIEARRTLAAALPGFINRPLLPGDDQRWFDLTKVTRDGQSSMAVHRFDRLSIGYSAEQWVFRIGRQTISWGNGLLFQPLDVFNPFSPTAVDKEFKTGDDMLYTQRLFDNGSDLQMVLIPRRDPLTGNIDSKQGSLALKYHGSAKDIEFDILLARHFDQPLLGLGFSGDIAGAVWRFDINVTELNNGDTANIAIFNLERSWTIKKRNTRGFIELYRNDLGARHKRYNTLDPELVARIQRGEVFTLARDYLVLGMQVEWKPRLNSFTHWIHNLNDDSNLLQIYLNFDWQQNLLLQGGVTLTHGDRGSEYGGIIVGPNSVVGTGDTAFLRLSFYF
jgi:hypothetical protein